MGGKVTLRKLAEELSVSPSTVLRALQGRGNVSSDLRRRIVQFAVRRRYKLPGHRTGHVAVIVAGMSMQGYLGMLILHLYNELTAAGFAPYIIAERETASLNEYMFDGLISTTWISGFEKKFPKDHILPMVSLNTRDNRLDNVYTVASDEIQGCTLGLTYLYRAGCRRIALLMRSAERNMTTYERINAFRQFCHDFNLPCEEPLVCKSFSRTILNSVFMKKPDAVFCATEGLALELYGYLRECGIRIPEDISVLGLETDHVSEFMVPGLTALRQDFQALAHESVKMLKQHINGEPVSENVRIPFQFIERESVRRPLS